ncbi:hypothetical protein GCM10025770_27020 [Viridibacterium curvum]|uniref:Uncharacterized protein n=1 Tax=Viridibacterium curvum TaxID=1101404 RepID=A0ABP9QV70_9RHOO
MAIAGPPAYNVGPFRGALRGLSHDKIPGSDPAAGLLQVPEPAARFNGAHRFRRSRGMVSKDRFPIVLIVIPAKAGIQ